MTPTATHPGEHRAGSLCLVKRRYNAVIMRLNGWQRLGVLLVVVWTITVGLVTWNSWPPTYLSLDPDGPGDWVDILDADDPLVKDDVIKQDERLTRPQFAARLKAKYPQYADLSDEELVTRTLQKFPQYSSHVGAGPLPEYPDPPAQELNRKNRYKAVRTALTLWLVPVVVVGGLGYGVTWVYRGFKTH